MHMHTHMHTDRHAHFHLLFHAIKTIEMNPLVNAKYITNDDTPHRMEYI